MRRTITLVAALGLALVGCASKGKTTVHAKPVNTICPVGKDPVGDAPTLLTTHRGQTVAFCCEGCEEMWATWTLAQRDEALAKVTQK